LHFIRPDGSIHPALAFVDMGSQFMTVRESLAKDLQLGHDRPVVFNVGSLAVTVPRAAVIREPRAPSSLGHRLKVEAVLPASVLQHYQVVIDYRSRTLVISRAGAVAPGGVAVPFRLNPQTGLIAVDVSIDGNVYPMTIDNGSAYTWVRQDIGQQWLASHPDWQRGVGAVGASNMTMSGDGTETLGTLLRIPEVSLGSVSLKDVGALAVGPGRPVSGNLDLFVWYSQKNPVAVIGWIGGNVLKGYRLTIDYPNHLTYWVQQNEPDIHDLDQVGVTLRTDGRAYFVSAVATKSGSATVDGVQPGDKLLGIDELNLAHATWGGVYAALHGKPGDTHSLMLERNGKPFTIRAAVTAF
jgi:hypothetical protein